jgi:hypothetical protein
MSVTTDPSKPLDHAAPSPWTARRRPARSQGRARATLSAWWNAWDLDRQLAAGVDPRVSPALALRAKRITGTRNRRRVADGLGRTLRSPRSRPAFTAAVRPDAREVLDARTVLAGLKRRVRSDQPVAPQGMAILQILLSDCTSPLYQPNQTGELGSRLRTAAAMLEPAGRHFTPALVAADSARDEVLP